MLQAAPSVSVQAAAGLIFHTMLWIKTLLLRHFRQLFLVIPPCKRRPHDAIVWDQHLACNTALELSMDHPRSRHQIQAWFQAQAR
jgi:hypothetical protein